MDEPREILFGTLRLMDPDPDMTPEQVRDYYSAQYPELTTAAIKVTEGQADGPQGITFEKPAEAGGGASAKKVEFVTSQGKRG